MFAQLRRIANRLEELLDGTSYIRLEENCAYVSHPTATLPDPSKPLPCPFCNYQGGFGYHTTHAVIPNSDQTVTKERYRYFGCNNTSCPVEPKTKGIRVPYPYNPEQFPEVDQRMIRYWNAQR